MRWGIGTVAPAGLLVTALGAPASGGEPSGTWITLINESESRLVAEFDLGLGDTQEKSYAWGDVNNNGWIDLVVARKQPFTTSGKRANVLFLNEGGVLVDRTAEYASAADQSQIVTSPGWPAWNTTNSWTEVYSGAPNINVTVNYGTHPDYFPDKGFLSPTNDRAVALVRCAQQRVARPHHFGGDQ